MSENENPLSFEEWSSMWDKLFTICTMKDDFRALLVHTVSNYNKKWNWKI